MSMLWSENGMDTVTPEMKTTRGSREKNALVGCLGLMVGSGVEWPFNV